MLTRKGVFRTFGLAFVLGGIGLTGAACDNDGPVEEAAEEAGEGIEEAGEEIEDAVD
jgi:hypothetical protein